MTLILARAFSRRVQSMVTLVRTLLISSAAMSLCDGVDQLLESGQRGIFDGGFVEGYTFTRPRVGSH